MKIACPVALQLSSCVLGSSFQSPLRRLKAFNPKNQSTCISIEKRIPLHRCINALFGGNSGNDKSKDKKKFITKEEEPDQYWQSAAEKEGRGPMSTILPYIVIFGFLTPFIILGLGFANGWIKVPIR